MQKFDFKPLILKILYSFAGAIVCLQVIHMDRAVSFCFYATLLSDADILDYMRIAKDGTTRILDACRNTHCICQCSDQCRPQQFSDHDAIP